MNLTHPERMMAIKRLELQAIMMNNANQAIQQMRDYLQRAEEDGMKAEIDYYRTKLDDYAAMKISAYNEYKSTLKELNQDAAISTNAVQLAENHS